MGSGKAAGTVFLKWRKSHALGEQHESAFPALKIIILKEYPIKFLFVLVI